MLVVACRHTCASGTIKLNFFAYLLRNAAGLWGTGWENYSSISLSEMAEKFKFGRDACFCAHCQIFLSQRNLRKDEQYRQTSEITTTTLFLPVYLVTKRPGKGVANICGWSMILYAANPDTIISPPVIIVLGTFVFYFNMVDIIIEINLLRREQLL